MGVLGKSRADEYGYAIRGWHPTGGGTRQVVDSVGGGSAAARMSGVAAPPFRHGDNVMIGAAGATHPMLYQFVTGDCHPCIPAEPCLTVLDLATPMQVRTDLVDQFVSPRTEFVSPAPTEFVSPPTSAADTRRVLGTCVNESRHRLLWRRAQQQLRAALN
jgi:hypothetical protein